MAQLLLLLLLTANLALAANGLRTLLAWGAALRQVFPGTYELAVAALVVSVALAALALLDRAFALLARRPRPAGGAPFRMLFCAAVLTAVATWIWLQPFRVVFAWAAIGLGAGAAGLALLLHARLAARPRARWLRPLDLLLTSACIALVTVELGMRGAQAVRPARILANAYTGPRELLERMRYAPGTIRWGYPVNARGDYDRDYPGRTPGERLVVCIGDSFSSGIVPYPLHYTSAAERHLESCEVYNMGAPATNMPEYLHLLVHEALPMSPDAIVIAVFVGNDLEVRETRRAGHQVMRALFERERVLVWRLFDRASRIARERRFAREEGEGESIGVPQGEGEAGTELVDEAAHALTLFHWLADPLQERAGFSERNFRELELNRARAACDPEAPWSDWFCSMLGSMKEAAGDTPLLVMLIPDEFQVEDALWAEVAAAAGGAPLERHRAQVAVAGCCAELGLPLLDLLPVLLAVDPLADGRQHVYHLRDTHFNTRGNGVAGEALAGFLREQLGR